MKFVCLAAALLSSLLVVFVDGFHCHRPKNLRLVASPSLNVNSKHEQQRINNHNNNHVRSIIMTSLAAATVTTATADYAMQELHEETVMVKANKALRKMKNEPSLYDILKVSNKATNQELKQAYVQLARKTHPDAATSATASSAEEFSNIAQAYNVLSNKKERLRYDRTLLAKAIQQTLEDHLMEFISMAVPMLNTFLTTYFIPFLQHVFKVLSLAWQTLQENTNGDNTSILQPLEIGSAQQLQQEESSSSSSSSSSMEEAKSVFVTLLKGTVSKAKHFLFKGFQNVEKMFQAIFDDNTMVII